jgi:alpha-L-glutamate ligase-like protein
MAKVFNTRDVLGMNARNRLYTSKNSKSARQLAHSKFFTKQVMMEQNLPVAKIIAILRDYDEIDNYDWSSLSSNFVLKPSNGSGGKGILVFKRRDERGDFIDTLNQRWSLEAIKVHCLDILDGKYSTHLGVMTTVIIEERVEGHPFLQKFSYMGTPDLRVIIYNSVPIMAMLRLPTRQSEGRANLHQGAIGVGIDLTTGLTTHAITGDGRHLTYLPGTKRKLSGVLIPYWDEVLLTAVRAANAAGLTYGGVDLFLDKEKGPIVVELNTSPGLSIQLANHQGLSRRLERVVDLQVLTPEHGVRISRALFRSNLAEKFIPPSALVEIGVINEGELVLGKKERRRVSFFVNTKRFRSSISQDLALELGWLRPEDLLWYQKTESGEKAPVIEVSFILEGRKIKTEMLVSKQLDKSKHKVHLGRRDLKGFLVKA